jgi:hypothetical protein
MRDETVVEIQVMPAFGSHDLRFGYLKNLQSCILEVWAPAS